MLLQYSQYSVYSIHKFNLISVISYTTDPCCTFVRSCSVVFVSSLRSSGIFIGVYNMADSISKCFICDDNLSNKESEIADSTQCVITYNGWRRY